jgi:environmental stress-induced protein Ves
VTSRLHLVRADDIRPVRWRNGGGWTRELLAWPDADDWTVRVSVADIADDGPFSPFPGVDRWFAVLDGNGVELDDGSGRVRLAPGDAIHRFRGEAAPACRLLGGATRDFNLMVRRGRASAVVVGPAGEAATVADWSGCVAGAPLRARLAGDYGWHEVPARALAWTVAPARLEIDAKDARGWRIDVALASGVPR